jgi:alkanesulfonate monooxygenase SsuD/methylene tetrahydromethanopterin reductase-like flavin-dependent oxidoreductase (luciferase family)
MAEWFLFLPQSRLGLDEIVTRAQAAEVCGFDAYWGAADDNGRVDVLHRGLRERGQRERHTGCR